MHLAGGPLTLWEILEPELTKDRVERAHIKRQRARITFAPIYCGTLGRRRGPRSSEHARIEIKTYHMTRWSDLRRDQA